MQIEFLGTGGYHPSERRHTACLIVPELGVVFDAGTAAFRLSSRLKQSELSIFLSHAHLDHIVGLTYLVVPLVKGDLTRVCVYGTRKTLDAVEQYLFAEDVFPVCPAFEFRALEDHPIINVGPAARVTHWPQVSHPGGSTGFRLEWKDGEIQKSMCYVTDTSVDGTYTEQIRGTDLLIHECYFPDTGRDWADKTGHSHVSAVLDLARQAVIQQLVLIHIDPLLPDDSVLGLDPSAVAGLPIRIASDGDSITL